MNHFSVCVQKLKVKVLEQVQDQFGEILDKALTESIEPPSHIKFLLTGKTAQKQMSRWEGCRVYNPTRWDLRLL